MIRILKHFFFLFGVLFIATAFTGAYFTSSAEVSGNSFETGYWDTGPYEGDVVINELMWMGSIGKTADEWIELKNTTTNDIDLSGWQITKVDSYGSESQMISVISGSVSAGGYFLIANNDKADSAINVDPNIVTSSVDLSNTNLKIRLYKGDWSDTANLIDTAGDGGVPLAGFNGGAQKQSMSRKAIPSDGWYTDTISNNLLFWDIIDNNFGTPGATNG